VCTPGRELQYQGAQLLDSEPQLLVLRILHGGHIQHLDGYDSAEGRLPEHHVCDI
jgi:hypothetical protein